MLDEAYIKDLNKFIAYVNEILNAGKLLSERKQLTKDLEAE